MRVEVTTTTTSTTATTALAVNTATHTKTCSKSQRQLPDYSCKGGLHWCKEGLHWRKGGLQPFAVGQAMVMEPPPPWPHSAVVLKRTLLMQEFERNYADTAGWREFVEKYPPPAPEGGLSKRKWDLAVFNYKMLFFESTGVMPKMSWYRSP